MSERSAKWSRQFLRSLGPIDILLVVLFSALTLALIGALILSLQWEGYWDQLYFHHIAYLIFVKGLAPYRDIFDINMFGIYVFHGAVGSLFGYGDLALRLVDIAWLVATGTVTILIMRKFDWRSAWLSAVLFGWIYITQGEMQALQREYLMILPMACSILIACSPTFLARFTWLRSLLIGLLFGLASCLKPNGMIGLPAVMLFESQSTLNAEIKVFDKRRLISFLKILPSSLLGLCLPIVLGVFWLWSRGSLRSFYEISTIYWPLYSKVVSMMTYTCMSDAQRTRVHVERILTFHNLYDRQWLILPALFAASLKLRRNYLTRETKMLVVLLLILFTLNLFQVIVVGQFHHYSWMPMIYFLVLLFSLSFSRASQEAPDLLHAALIIAAILASACVLSYVAGTFRRQLAGGRPYTTWTVRAKEMSDFLKSHQRPGDEVQVFDFLGGTTRAMLDSGAMPATPILTDAFLSLMVKNPYVVRMRRDFFEMLKSKRPKFIILVKSKRLFSFDPDEDGEFIKELNIFLAQNYTLACQGDGYQILEVLSEEMAPGAGKPAGP